MKSKPQAEPSIHNQHQPILSVTKPPLPMAWLDTWAVIELTKAVKTGEVAGDLAVKYRRIYELLIELRDGQKILCPESEQLLEIELGDRLIDEAKEVLSQISSGISTHHLLASDSQIQNGMRAYLRKKRRVDIDWRDPFVSDPLTELKENQEFREKHGLILRIDLGHKREIEEAKDQRPKLAATLEEIRGETALAKKSFQQVLDEEKRAVQTATAKFLAACVAKIIRKEQLTQGEYNRFTDLIGIPLSYWKRFGGKDDQFGGILGLVEFYDSDYYTKLPYFEIQAELMASKRVGQESFNKGDVADIENISSLLPHSHYMVLDKQMRHKIRQLKLDARFSTSVVSLLELLPILERLSRTNRAARPSTDPRSPS